MSDEGSDTPKEINISCPAPVGRYDAITMAHGGGGRLMRALVDEIFLPAFSNPMLQPLHDGALLESGGKRLAMTTDGYVVQPLFFPGGDIGKLAVCGTVNDLAMCAARPLYLSAAFVLEEGLKIETLQRVVESMRRTADEAGVAIVTGDTKVVERGRGDGLTITTAGVGEILVEKTVGPASVREGAAVLLSGDVGRHGIAIMASREGLAFQTSIQSDCAPLGGLVEALVGSGAEIQCLRDLTRGGLATALIEIAEGSGRPVVLKEEAVPVAPEVRSASELLGLDPLYIANEGRMVAFVAEADAERALEALRAHSLGQGARRVATVGSEQEESRVLLETPFGTRRILEMQSGEQMPRIC